LIRSAARWRLLGLSDGQCQRFGPSVAAHACLKPPAQRLTN
jgi:hypothetical protein